MSAGSADVPAPRVLHVVRSLYTGGVARSLLTNLVALEDRCGPQVVCTLTRRGPLAERFEAAGVQVRCLGHRGIGDLPRTVRRLRGLLSSGRFEVAHSHLLLAQVITGLATFGTPRAHVTTLHSSAPGPPSTAGGRRPRALLRRFGLGAVDRYGVDALVAVGPAVQAARLGQRPQDGDRLVTIDNAVDLAHLPTDVDVDAVRSALGADGSQLLVLNVGRLVEAKRQRDLVAIAAAAAERDLDVVVAIAGAGALEAELREAIERSPVAEAVRLLGGRDDVPELLAASDVVVVTSATEGSSIALIEAMAAGRPVVASRIPANEDLIGDGETGWLVGVGDVAGYVEALRSIRADPVEAARRGARAREVVGERHDARVVAASLESLYRRVAAGEIGRPPRRR